MDNMLDTSIHYESCKVKEMKSSNWRINFNLFIFVLVVFIAIAARQALELNNMLSETKALSKEISGIRTGQEILLKQYAYKSNNNNLSYYLNNC